MLALAPARLRADAVVVGCSADNQPSASMDLRRAIAMGGRVTFSCPASTVIAITMTHYIPSSVVIDGGDSVTLDAGGNVPMFSISNPSIVLTLNRITLRRGRSFPNPFPHPNPGGNGGIASGQGVVEFDHAHVQNTMNAVWMLQGAVRATDSDFTGGVGTALSAPTLEVTRTRFSGAGIHPLQNYGGTVTIVNSDFIGTDSSTFDKCQLSISTSRFSGSTSTAVVSSCDTSISSTIFQNNHGQNGGALFLSKTAAGLHINGGKFAGNTADANGGAIALEAVPGPARPIALSDVVFDGNRAADGGALSLGTAIENNVNIMGRALIFNANHAKNSGGAIAGTNAQVALTRVAFSGNSAGARGGALSLTNYAERPSVIANALFTGNSAQHGAVLVGSAMQFRNVTLANSTEGPAITPFWPAPDPGFVIALFNTILVSNAAGACDNGATNNLNHPLYQDGGHNVQFPSSDCVGVQVADPKLDSMFIPGRDGAASGKGDLQVCVGAPVDAVDLFGRHRPQGKSCSIGAVEGDIEDAVELANPQYRKPPAVAPNGNCSCDAGATQILKPPSQPSAGTLPPPAPPTAPGRTSPQPQTPSPSVPPQATSPSSSPKTSPPFIPPQKWR